MSEWKQKRFWTSVDVNAAGESYSIELDGRPVRTPSKTLLALPTQAMAEKVAEEWEAQTDEINPMSMPWTRSANSAIDKVGSQRSDIETFLIGYAETDLLCYRAVGPEELAHRQSREWDPLLDWLNSDFGVHLNVTSGVMPIAQNTAELSKLQPVLSHMSDFELTGFHDLVTLPGSFILGLAVVRNRISHSTAWKASRLDENWQMELWGEDEEAADNATQKFQAFSHATEFYRFSKE